MSTTKDDSVRDADQCNSDPEPTLSDARMEANPGRKLFSRVAAGLFPSHRLLGLRAAWRELCSLPSRIAILQRNNWFRYGIPLESSSQLASPQSAIRHRFRRARIRGIRKALSIHPALTPLDLYILLRTIDRDLFEEDQEMAAE